MSFYSLSKAIEFPPPDLADSDGMLAIGGDLSTERLLLAYEKGIFPWYSEGLPICWWSPDPRFVLYPEKLKITKSMMQVMKNKHFNITFDNDFERVIQSCKTVARAGQEDTWITEDMLDAYCLLHEKGYAHSVEAWKGDELVGGLYGVSLGKCFFGESMFSNEKNASKAALITLANTEKFHLIDCQVYTAHLQTMGAEEIPRAQFLTEVEYLLKHESIIGNWGEMKAFHRYNHDFNR